VKDLNCFLVSEFKEVDERGNECLWGESNMFKGSYEELFTRNTGDIIS
jgi:hypothetical protein